MEQVPEELSGNAQWLMDEWAAALAAAAESMTGERPEVQWKAEAGAEAGPESGGAGPQAGWLWWEQSLPVIPQAAMWVGALEHAWGEVGKRTLRAAGIESNDPADARNAYLEIVAQSFGGLTQAIAERLGKDAAAGPGREGAPAAGVYGFSAVLRYPGLELPLAAALSPALVEALAGKTGPTSGEATDRPEAAQAEAQQQPETGMASKTLDLLLDVELPVSVSFGRTELPIKDVLKLTTGSIVELNRSLSEPVEVVVNNCVIARGEVVVVDGNYGVRLQQIVSRQDRLRSLK